MLGTTYRNDYANPESEAELRMSQAEYAFINTWLIGFDISMAYVDPLPIDACTASTYSLCDNSICGSLCTNSTVTQIHHKNAFKNQDYIRSYVSLSNYDLMITFVSADMCGIINGSHSTGYVRGVATRSGDYAIVSNYSAINQNMRVRIIQHEISHLFGCTDSACTEGYPCIMNGGYDNLSLNIEDIWCPACKTRFNPNTH